MRGATTSIAGSGTPRGLARGAEPPVASPQQRPRPKRGAKGGRRTSFHFRVDDSEHAALKDAANAAGLAPGSYVRAKVFGGNPPRAVRVPPIEREALAVLLAQIGRIGGNLNQLAKAVNSGMLVAGSDLTEALTDLRVLREELRAVLGRKAP